jgi:hypothetical protein
MTSRCPAELHAWNPVRQYQSPANNNLQAAADMIAKSSFGKEKETRIAYLQAA